ncbi:hypothetical protein FAI41_03755 [Acetobacteraceae bacterium]|nr:hypothetical protein FAI41_03755 [Acetobacteraceae bacterium]
MSCYELIGVKEDKLGLTSLISGEDFACIDIDGLRDDPRRIIFLSAKTAMDKVKSLGLEEKATIKRFPYDLQMIPNRKEYIGEEISFQTLVSEAESR